MFAAQAAGLVLVFASAGWSVADPRKSSDVASIQLKRLSMADGMESYSVTLKLAKGWHVRIDPVAERHKISTAPVVQFQIDGDRAYAEKYATIFGELVTRRDASGREYKACEGTVSFLTYLIWDDTKDAEVVSVSVKLIATDGKTRLKESILTAEVR